ncbi:MAG: type VI secretion system-associated FHA domain protein TagH [Rhodospirillales bacterium]|nr:type VI secretion system-associated FHA domain protein TagH [Rhodospirillales bacterium]
MRLTLTLLRCPDTVAPERRVVTGGEYSLGRGPDNDWVLPDPPRLLSKRHCLIAFRSGAWHVTDLSTNGTYINDETTPAGSHSRPLRHRDRLVLGAYEIEAEIEEAKSNDRSPWLEESNDLPGDGFSASPVPGHHLGSFERNPFGRDASAPDDPNHAARTGYKPNDGLGRFSSSYDDDVFSAPPQPDHSPAFTDAYRPPSAIVPIPDDWDFDFSDTQPTSARSGLTGEKPREQPTRPTSEPESDQRPGHANGAGSRATRSGASRPGSGWPGTDAFASPEPDSARSDGTQSRAKSDPLLLAFLRGAGADDARIDDPVRAMEGLGAVLRAMVSGLRQALIARLSVKGEFRIEQTMIRASGNNPLKFSASDDDAIEAMLGDGRRGGMKPAAAVTEALRDIQLHELATITAMQEAVRSLLSRFDPEMLEQQANQGGSGFGRLLNSGKMRAWDAFVSLHGEITEALSDDFDNAFGKAFARAYEQALEQMTERDRTR